MKPFQKMLVLGLIAGTSLLTGCISSGADDAASENAARTQGSAPGSDTNGVDGAAKVAICHIPPGNPANAHSITVGAPAVSAHLAHGDALGACPDVIPPVDTVPPVDTLPPDESLN